jgi:hypothetical protein
MRKFLASVALLFSLEASAQVTKAVLIQDFSLSKNSFVKVPFRVTEFDSPITSHAPGPGINGNDEVSQLIPGGYFYAWNPGYFYFWAQVSFGKSCNGTRRTVAFLRNGDERKPFGSAGIAPPFLCDEAMTLQVNGFVKLDAGEWVTLNVFQDAEDTLPIEARVGDVAKTWVNLIRLPQ